MQKDEIELVAKAITLANAKLVPARELRGCTPEQVAEHGWESSVPAARAAIAALNIGPQKTFYMTPWQPIATAPKYSEILVASEGLYGGVYVSFWDHESECWSTDTDGKNDVTRLANQPTLWSHLPDPPFN